MSTDPHYFDVIRTDGVVVVTPVGREIHAEARDPLFQAADDLRNEPPPRRLLLDLRNVQTINSSTIGVLVNFSRRVKESAGVLKVCHPDPFVKNVIELTKMNQLLDIYATDREAFDAFRHKPGASAERSKSWSSRFFGSR